MRLHFVISAVVIGLGFILRLSALEMLFIFSAIFAVLVTELFNTAVEASIDLFTRERHPLAAIAKDVAAGAVMVACGYAAVVGVVVFSNHGWLGKLRILATPAGMERLTEAQYLLIGIILVLLVVLAIKERGRRGELLHGGVISGHAALGFYAATVLLLTMQNKVLALLAFIPALLLAQSRIEGGIHTVREVIMGGLVGTALAALVFFAGAALGH